MRGADSPSVHTQQPRPAMPSASSSVLAEKWPDSDLADEELEQFDVVALALHLGHELLNGFLDGHAAHDGFEHREFLAGRILALDLGLKLNPLRGVVQELQGGNQRAQVAQ